ncbi:MAG TPA: ATP-binding protein [Verrucomicrobiae bacterium]|nr:ATP-binding protein [Verrucomicrobiae bacterium]
MVHKASINLGLLRGIPRGAGRVLLAAATVVVVAFGVILLGPSPRWTQFLDNLHWSTSYAAAAVLAWIGVRSALPEDAPARRWFAVGLSAYAAGQFLWDMQVAFGWNPFPSPSDSLFLCLGPCCALGLLSSLRTRASRADWGTAGMDAVGLVVVVLVLALALYLPRRGNSSAWELACMVLYPVGMVGAAGLGAVLVPILRLRLDAVTGLFLGALIVNGLLWMRWNALTLEHGLSDGSFFNVTFSVTALALGAGALRWRAIVSTDPAWERACDWILRLLPLLLVGGSVLAVALVAMLPGVPPAIRLLVQAGALVSSALALGRQSLLLAERDRLLHAARELRRAEEMRRELEAHLRQAQKMEALGTLAGGIAHDFNNILGTILGNVALARQDVGANPNALTSLAEISKASHRAKHLVQQILAFSRLSEVGSRDVIRLGPVVEEVVAMLRASIPAGIHLVFHEAPETPTICADANQIHQVLVNLCTNSWHALGVKGGQIEIRTEASTVKTGGASGQANLPPGRYACLSVTDNGTGMDAATQERIFEPFYTTKEASQGTGLGLAVVHGIVRSHQGAITVRSQPGQGTTVAIYLPAMDGVPETPGAPSMELPRGQGQRLLYVDDEEALVRMATRLFERLNYRVTACTCAADALQKLEQDPEAFDLVVTDYNMPGLSGLELARRVRALCPTLPVVMASGYMTEDLKAQAMAAGVAHVVYKPNTVEELCQAVDKVFSREPLPTAERRLKVP